MKSELGNKSKQIKGLADVIIKVMVKELLAEESSHNKHENLSLNRKGNNR